MAYRKWPATKRSSKTTTEGTFHFHVYHAVHQRVLHHLGFSIGPDATIDISILHIFFPYFTSFSTSFSSSFLCRLSVAVEQYNNKLSMVLDANGILTQAFEKLKKETGLFIRFCICLFCFCCISALIQLCHESTNRFFPIKTCITTRISVLTCFLKYMTRIYHYVPPLLTFSFPPFLP